MVLIEKENNAETVEKSIEILEKLIPYGTPMNNEKVNEIINVLCGSIVLFIVNAVKKESYKTLLKQSIRMLTVNINEKLNDETID